jgi:dynein heavy chain
VSEGEPAVMWLSGLHIPESYLTALVQATCRKNGWPLDKSTLYTTVTQYEKPEDVKERSHAGCFVSGLYLEGASWDVEASCLRRPRPKVLVEELPILKVIPIEAHRLKLQVCLEMVFTEVLKG